MLAEDESNRTLLDTAFNANYGWSILHKMGSAAQSSSAGQASEAKARLEESLSILEGYPQGNYAMTFITNHDENSWNGTEYDRLGSSVKLLSVFYFTAPGMPLIYSGQEVGLNRKLAFFEKDPIQWSSSPMTAFYSKLVALKTKNAALNVGPVMSKISYIASSSPAGLLAYGRVSGKSKVVVVLNPSKSPTTTTLAAGSFAGTYYNVFTGAKVTFTPKQKFVLPANGYLVLSTVK